MSGDDFVRVDTAEKYRQRAEKAEAEVERLREWQRQVCDHFGYDADDDPEASDIVLGTAIPYTLGVASATDAIAAEVERLRDGLALEVRESTVERQAQWRRAEKAETENERLRENFDALHREWRVECDLRQEAQRIASERDAELRQLRVLWETLAPNCKHQIIGIRDSETGKFSKNVKELLVKAAKDYRDFGTATHEVGMIKMGMCDILDSLHEQGYRLVKITDDGENNA